MEVKIKICTPKGQAKGTLWKLKPFIIGFNKAKIDAYHDKDDSIIYLNVEGTPRQVLAITRNCNMYGSFVEQVFKQKVMGKSIQQLSDSFISKEDMQELENMLKNGTTVEIIKYATANEITEDNKTLWQRIKEKFTKVDPNGNN